jgi:hypothetical protein
VICYRLKKVFGSGLCLFCVDEAQIRCLMEKRAAVGKRERRAAKPLLEFKEKIMH